MRELLAQCEASEMDLQQQQQLPSMPSLVPSISVADNLTARRTKVRVLPCVLPCVASQERAKRPVGPRAERSNP